MLKKSSLSFLLWAAFLVPFSFSQEGDLNLEEKGGALPQTAPVNYQGNLTNIFLKHYGFPAATSSNEDPVTKVLSPSLFSTSDGITPDLKWKLTTSLGTLGVGRGNSEHFDLQLNPLKESRPSIYKIQRIQRIRIPISAPR